MGVRWGEVCAVGGGSAGWFVEIPLKSRKQLADVFGFAEIGDGVGDRVLIAEAQQWRERPPDSVVL